MRVSTLLYLQYIKLVFIKLELCISSKLFLNFGDSYKLYFYIHGRLQHGGSGAIVPLPSVNGDEGGKFCPFERRRSDILSVLYLQLIFPELHFSSRPNHGGPVY